jgi:hypothetical protein
MKNSLWNAKRGCRPEVLADEVIGLKIEAVARARVKTPREDYISHKEMEIFLNTL